MASSTRSLYSIEERAKARAFVELIGYIITSLEDEIQTLRLAELDWIYQQRGWK